MKGKEARYGLMSNILWMIRQARDAGFPGIPPVVVLCAVLAALVSTAQVLFAPQVLRCIEAGDTAEQLLSAVLRLAVPLMLFSGLKEYLTQRIFFDKSNIRVYILRCLNRHHAMTSYPNTEDPALCGKVNKACFATQGNNTATEAVWDRMEKLLVNALCFAVYLFLLRHMEPLPLLLIAGTTVAEHFVNRRINRWGFLHREESAAYGKKLDYITLKAEDTALGKDIRIFGMRAWLSDVYAHTLRLYDAFLKKREGIYLWTNVIDVLLTVFRNGFAYYYLLRMVLQGNLVASEFLLYFSAASGFGQWIAGIMDELTALEKMSLEISTVREVFDAAEPFRFTGGRAIPEAPDGRYELKLEGVSFRYPGAEQDALTDIDLTLAPGEKLAVVGLNGAGKTTLVKLLCGLYDPTRGRVLLNGTDIREFNRDAYYALFTALFQQSAPMEVTVAENVAQTDTGIDREKVWECLSRASLSRRIRSLPHGIDTHIGHTVFEDGAELSGGETQRLLLARALYRNAPVLLLDEPTSALDPIAESEVYDRYHQMSAGRTSVFISHRLASTRFCDRIILLANGRLAEEGTHEGLLAARGAYAALFETQSRYYREEEAHEA